MLSPSANSSMYSPKVLTPRNSGLLEPVTFLEAPPGKHKWTNCNKRNWNNHNPDN